MHRYDESKISLLDLRSKRHFCKKKEDEELKMSNIVPHANNECDNPML